MNGSTATLLNYQPEASQVSKVLPVPVMAVPAVSLSDLGLTTLSDKGPLERLPTGVAALDTLLGGGIPKGRVIEAFGGEGSGKTTFVLHCLAQVQARGGVGALVEPENALDSAYAARLGINLEAVPYNCPSTGNVAIELIGRLIASNQFDLIILDSVAALLPALQDGTFYAETYEHAYMLSQGLRFLNSVMGQAERPCTLIFTNQIRLNGPTGGQALSFFSSLRLNFSKGAQIKCGKTPIGRTIKVQIVKNKCGLAERSTSIKMLAGEGFVAHV